MSLFNKIVKCNGKGCNNEMDAWDYNYEGGLCSSCKFRKGLILAISFFIVAFLVSIPIANFQFGYDLEKCDNLKSKESSYDFTNRIEVNAQYNENCYFLKNHPLAFLSYILVGGLFSVLIGMLGVMISLFIKPRNFRRILDDD